MTNCYREHIERHLQQALTEAKLPPLLNAPVAYALQSGGKRLRPQITLLTAEACGCSLEAALPIATAIEILHNFTLVHDDIMDRSPLRRGKATVFTQWDEATAILAGDTMMGIAYGMLSSAYPPHRCRQLVQEFSSAFVEVCIGQAEDLAFRTSSHVTMEQYLGMISRKTARLFATAAVCGGIVANAEPAILEALRQWGTALGIAFQVQDDMLDLLGTPEFGKQRGQDLREGKKTFPILAAYSAVTSDSDRMLLETYLSSSGVSSQNDIDQIADLCRRLDIPSVAQATIDRYIDQAQATLVTVLPPSEARAQLLAIADQTRTRQL